MKQLIKLRVNEETYEVRADPWKTLVDVLREDIGLTGTKEGCGAGECGACTVCLDGLAVNACVVLAVEVDGRTIETIEGEAKNGKLSTIQEAFNRHHAVQCGFCTGGMIMSAHALLARNAQPTVEEIKAGLEGNFCRCTGYQQIIEAVLDASGQLTEKGGLKYA